MDSNLYIMNGKKIIKCKECKFLNTWIKNSTVINCIGMCNKTKEFCTFFDGCTFGKKQPYGISGETMNNRSSSLGF